MHQSRIRLVAIAILLIFVAMTYYNWRELAVDGRYSMKMAVFGPVGILGGIFLLVFPSKFGKPETTKDKVIALSVFGMGVLAGIWNWYLMDPGYFGR